MPSDQRFEKSVKCPTNESLLAFLQTDRGELSAAELRIVEHLVTCEFCELALELLRTYPTPSVSEPLPAPPVPEQIRQLFPVHK